MRELSACLAQSRSGPLFLASEHITERLLEPLAEATTNDAISHLDEFTSHLETLSAWDADAPHGKNTETVFVLERFHISLGSHISGIDWASLANIDNRLSSLNTLIVWCSLPDDQLLERSVRSPLSYRNSYWKSYLATLGADENMQADHFRNEQNRLEALFRQSILEKIRIEICRENVREIAQMLTRRHLPSDNRD
ncbi:MAG: hypothetical protein HQM09_20345 [Candidatus Riflebacteria bacterium]|nr:hypothetical protein [Candidatus Riflebacteria bacterium]